MSPKINIRQSKDISDIKGISRLQQANLAKHISADEAREQGFVTCDHTVEMLDRMSRPHPHIIAVDEDRVVGYALTMMESLRDEVPEIVPMFAQIDVEMERREWHDRSYLVMGQVCVAKSHRGQGVFYQLYDEMKTQMAGHFDLIITEISAHNTRSLRAHEKQGFKVMKEYVAPDGHPWVIVSWDWS